MGHRVTTLALTVGSPSAHRRVAMLKLISVLVLILTIGVGSAWGTDLSFTFEDNSAHRTSGNNSYTEGPQYYTQHNCSISCSYMDIVTTGTPISGSANALGRVAKNATTSPTLTIGPIDLSDKTITGISYNTLGVTTMNQKCEYSTDGTSWGTAISNFALTATSDSKSSGTLNISGTKTFYVKITTTVSSAGAKRDMQIDDVVISYETATSSCTVKPTVGEDLISVSVTANSITATIPISAIGGCNITENGLVYSTSVETPTVGAANCTKVTTDACGATAANKTVTITGLTCGTTYYVRGYAINGAGTQYTTNTTTQATSACPTYTVTLKDDNSTLPQASYGAEVELPSRDGCTGYTFAGWTKTWTSAQSEWTTTAPTIIEAGSYTPEGDEELYPVYTKTESGGGTSYVLTAASAVTAGTYVIGIAGSSGYYIATGLTGTSSVDMAVNSETDVTLTNNAFTTLPTGGMELTFTGNNTDGFTISNSDGNELSYSSYANRKLSFAETGKTWKVVEADSKLVLQSYDENVGYYTISQNGTNSIRGYASDTKYNTLYLFKKSGGSTTSYISVPNCCTELGSINGSFLRYHFSDHFWPFWTNQQISVYFS